MRFVDHHRPTVKAMAIELVAGFVRVFGGHFHEGETVSDNRDGQNLADSAEDVFDGGSLHAVRKVPDQKLFCGRNSCHLNTYARK